MPTARSGTSTRAASTPVRSRAGTYTLHKNSDLDSVIAVLEKGPTKRTSSGAYLPAGLTVDEVTSQLSKGVERWTTKEIDAALHSGQVHSSLQPAGQSSWEGLLYPGTYTVSRRTELVAFLNGRHLEDGDGRRQPGPGPGHRRDQRQVGPPPVDLRPPHGRVAHPAARPGSEAEMPKIATVIYNRLAEGQRLGIDATSLYYAKQHADRRRLRRRHAVQHPHERRTPAHADLDDRRRRPACRPAPRGRTVALLRPRGEGRSTSSPTDPDDFEKGRKPASTATSAAADASGDRLMGDVLGTTTVAGVIGHPIRHSLSPLLLNAAFAAATSTGCTPRSTSPRAGAVRSRRCGRSASAACP